MVRHFYLQPHSGLISGYYDGVADLNLSVLNRSGFPQCSYSIDIDRYKFTVYNPFSEEHEKVVSNLMSYSVNRAMSNHKLLACLAASG